MAEAEEIFDDVIVGAGLTGLTLGKRLLAEGVDSFVILDRLQGVGGVWNEGSWSNASSQVQIVEPMYRMDDAVQLPDFTPRAALLCEMDRVCDGALRPKLRLGVTVDYITDYSRGGTADAASAPFSTVSCIRDSGSDGGGGGSGGSGSGGGGGPFTLRARRAVVLCTGGLQVPRRVTFPGEALFNGDVIYGINGSVDAVDFRGKRVAVVGMGAFAIECARTALLAGAAHVTLVARSFNPVLPQVRSCGSSRGARGSRWHSPLVPVLPSRPHVRG